LPSLSIVVPVYDNWWLTRRCLRELDRYRDGSVSFETIVIDNGSHDETPHAIAEFSWVRYLRHETNRNFAGACNVGARLAESPVTLFLNNDAYPLGDAFTPLARAFENPNVAIAGGALFFEDGVTQAAGLVLLPNAHWHYYCRNLPMATEVGRSRDALAVSGAAMAVRTEWFLESGAFDESYVNGFEDVDLCMRAREQGYAVAYVANSRFAHYEAASAGRFEREAENERRFYQRWSPALAALPRTARGEVGAIAVHHSDGEDALLCAAREDLEAALRAFGHPLVRGAVAPWRRLDARFRRAANLAWFSEECPEPGVTVNDIAGGLPVLRTSGATTFEEPWLPCAAPERVARCGVRRSNDPSGVLGIVGDDAGFSFDAPVVRITPRMLLGAERVEVAAVLHAGLTDGAAFGNVLLAQAGIPAIVPAGSELQRLFAPDVSFACEHEAVPDAGHALASDPVLRAQYGALVAADARRRFSPRRSAVRIVDLLCASRFGPERPGTARSDAPF
jgi:GT2 family glycosyltransferase